MSNQLFDDLLDSLDAAQIASALRISRAGAYTLLSSEDFPTLHIGRRKLVMKNDLITWLKSHTNSCRNYAVSWACPPAIGTIEECRDCVNQYNNRLLLSAKYELENSFDFEDMLNPECNFHNTCL